MAFTAGRTPARSAVTELRAAQPAPTDPDLSLYDAIDNSSSDPVAQRPISVGSPVYEPMDGLSGGDLPDFVPDGLPIYADNLDFGSTDASAGVVPSDTGSVQYSAIANPHQAAAAEMPVYSDMDMSANSAGDAESNYESFAVSGDVIYSPTPSTGAAHEDGSSSGGAAVQVEMPLYSQVRKPAPDPDDELEL